MIQGLRVGIGLGVSFLRNVLSGGTPPTPGEDMSWDGDPLTWSGEVITYS